MEDSCVKADTDSIDSNLKPIPQERAFLESFFYTVAQFQFDRAHELSEKEKDQFKPIPGSSWMCLLGSLTNFAVVEKSYFTMTFVERRLLRRDIIRPLYCNVSSELKKILSIKDKRTYIPRESCNVETLSVELSKQLCEFVQARLKLIDFYEFMAKSGWNKINNTEELIRAISEVSQEFGKKFHHPILDPLKTSFSYEVEVVLNLFQTEIHLSEWDFLGSLLSLKECQAKLHAWCMLLNPALSVKEQLLSTFSYKSFFGRTNKKQTDIPFLYHWLHQFYENLLSKFSFYFYTTLSAQALAADFKTCTSKLNIDYISKLYNFEKKTDTCCISVVLETSTKKDIFRGHGYHLDNTIRDQPTGMNSFPSIITIPEPRPKEHWPNVVSMITDHSQELIVDKVVYFFDSKLDSSYFLIKIDVRMTLLLMYKSKKKERDSYIQGFLNNFRSLLQHENMYQLLKPGQGKVFEKK